VKSVSGLAYKSSEIPDLDGYDLVAREYYDERLHPTCADFRAASQIYLGRLFETLRPSGRLADIGCGKSLIAKFKTDGLVLIDRSRKMLEQNSPALERRCIDVETESFGVSEFDWIFAVLGDPYNSPGTWKNVERALTLEGQCIFIVPSIDWATAFRTACEEERPNLARFLTSKGEAVYLRSLIVEPKEQRRMIEQANLSLVATEHVHVGELPYLRSPKISEFLLAHQSLLDIYRVKKF
jgi:hypothetical protein